MAQTQILMNRFKGQKPTRGQQLQSMEYPGRKMGGVHGSHISDLAEMRAAILLCSDCQHKFNPSAYGYYRTREFNVQGECDACKEFAQGPNQPVLFIHQSSIGTKHGQCWVAK